MDNNNKRHSQYNGGENKKQRMNSDFSKTLPPLPTKENWESLSIKEQLLSQVCILLNIFHHSRHMISILL